MSLLKLFELYVAHTNVIEFVRHSVDENDVSVCFMHTDRQGWSWHWGDVRSTASFTSKDEARKDAEAVLGKRAASVAGAV